MITTQTDSRKMICDRCRNAVPISDIKYLPKGKDEKISLCSACREKGAVDEKTAKAGKKTVRKSYFCARCRYKFHFNPQGIASLKCPYCGNEDKIIDAEVKSSEALLKSISGNRF